MQLQYVSIDFMPGLFVNWSVFFFSANFFLQFLIMSALVGIPLFTFHVSLGQLLASGTMDMWKISPVFQVQYCVDSFNFWAENEQYFKFEISRKFYLPY